MTAPSALRWAVLGLSAAALYLCWPLWPALVLAAWTAALARPLLARFERGLKGRRRAAALLVLLLFLVLLVPLSLVGLGVVSGAQELWASLSRSPSAKSALEAIAAGGDATPPIAWPTSVGQALELLERFGAQGLSVLSGVAGAAARGIVGVFIYLGGTFVLLHDGPVAWSWVQRHSPLLPRHLERLGAAFQETGRGLLIGVGLTAATQGLAATLVYVSLGVPRWWVLGPLTGLAAIIPLIGTSLIWAPVGVGLLLTGHPVKAAVLFALGVGLISTVDNVLRPIYARLNLKLPTFVLFVAVFGGLATVGPWGALLGPLVVRLWIEALALRREEAQANDAAAIERPERVA